MAAVDDGDRSGTGRVRLVVSYFRDGSHYPRSGKAEKQGDLYWANIAVNAATLRHVAGAEPVFTVFAGDQPAGGAAEVLARADVDIRHLPFSRRPPDDFYVKYLGTLYLFDAMAALAPEVADDEVILFVDPDIVWVRTLDPLLDEVREGGVVAYELAVPDDKPMCDLTRREQSDILAEMIGEGPAETPLTHFGGEIYGMLGSELVALQPMLESLWAGTMDRYREGRRLHFNMDEHVMNGLLWLRGERVGRANPLFQRIRTLPAPFGTRDRVHDDLVAWHLPMEKDKGFLRVLRHLAAGRALPPAGDEYRRWLGQQMGIAPTGIRWAADRGRQLKWAVTGRSWHGDPNYGL